MDETQQHRILKSIAVSSGTSGILNVTQQDRHEAFRLLQEFSKYDGRIPICIQWLHQERLMMDGTIDVTVSTKLYALGLLQTFVQTGYARLTEEDRLALRYAVVTTARQLAPLSATAGETPVLGNKVASLLANLMIRDFPQRWPSFFQDLFVPMSTGGIWYNSESSSSDPIIVTMGVKMGLECLKLVTEDCTDSDFNSKISTTRRNDVLIGLNEVSSQFLPLLFHLLEQYSTLQATKATLFNMRSFLTSNGRSLAQMTPEEATMYQTENTKQNQIGRLLADCLVTTSRFCQSMPLEWILGATADGKGGAPPPPNQQLNFVAALLHLLREHVADIQVHAVECFENLAIRKIDRRDWTRLISSLPQAISDANQMAQVESEQGGLSASDLLVSQLNFHRGLSKMLATLLASHVNHITTNKDIIKGTGPQYQAVSTFLRLLVDILHHPSGQIAAKQVNTWIALLRDPQVVRTNLLTPFVEELLSCYMDKMIRIQWKDVEDGTHPQAALLEQSWDDEDEYDAWLCDLRSKSSQLFKFLSHTEPKIASAVICIRVQALLNAHGNGEPRDHIDPTNNQLTAKSEACVQFEGLHQALDNILNGLPSWSLQEDLPSNSNQERINIRTSVRASLAQMASAIVSWDPQYLWLKFRRATLLEALRHYWKHDPSTLLSGVDSLLKYLSAPDDFKPRNLPRSAVSEGKLSGEVIGLRKKAGVSLVAVSKVVPQHLAPWLPQLSEATKALLSSEELLPISRNHLYEFLSCVANAVEDPMARSNFIADVLSESIKTLESPEVQETVSSVERFLSSIGILQAATFPESVTDPTNVGLVTAKFVRLFSAVNQLLAVGKRCHEAARRRPNGGIPLQSIPQSTSTQNFPDEGPVSLRDLAVNDPFVPLWPRILPRLLQILDVILRVWHPEEQAVLLQNPIQRYVLAISDDEAYLSRQHATGNGGVFGEGGTAGSIVSGYDRRDVNLAPKWSGWLNELRNTCFQMLGLLAGQRALYAPELANMFPQFVAIMVNAQHLQAMEHRHFTQYMKQFIEILLLSCPVTIYSSHLAPIVGPVFEHLQYRLEKTWSPVIEPNAKPDYARALSSDTCVDAAALASRGGEEWFAQYYARGGLFVGDLDSTTAEACVEKFRVEISRSFSDMMQSALALKGDWALVLANQAKEEGAAKRGDPSRLSARPHNRPNDGRQVNADGTPRADNQEAIDARKFSRINSLCHFLLLENERVAGSLTLTIIQALGYPDAYTCRRCTRICHRILETVAWSPHYTPLLGNKMFILAAKNIVTEPKWMVGVEWDVINVLRDVYCRLVLGQVLQPGGQGPGLQQSRDPNNPGQFDQAKSVANPLQGGGILTVPSDSPRQILASLPGVGIDAVKLLESRLNSNRSSKDQKDILRDLLRVAAETSNSGSDVSVGAAGGLFDRAIAEESLLNQKANNKATVPDIPEKLVTVSMMQKKEASARNASDEGPAGLSAFLFE